ncbi:hypothetical protein ACA910_015991 [Epithemia clementina (nom. ined.)]
MNSTLGGAMEPSDNFNMDQAAVKVCLHPGTTTSMITNTTTNKKPLTILPEVSPQPLLYQAQLHVAQDTKLLLIVVAVEICEIKQAFVMA